MTGFIVQREAWNWSVATFLRIALGIAVLSVPVWIGIAVLGGSGAGFGEVLVATRSERSRVVNGEFAEIPIRVSNKGSQPIQLLKIQSSCGCVTAKPDFESLAPRESGTIHVSFRSPFTEPIITRKVDRDATVRIHYQTSDSGKMELAIPISVTLCSPVSIDNVHYMVLNLPDNDAEVNCDVQVKVDCNIRIDSVASTSPEICVRLIDTDMIGHATVGIVVSNPRSVFRTRDASPQLVFPLRGSNGLFVVAVPIHASMIRSLHFSPSTTVLGPVEPGVQVCKRVSVSSPLGQITDLNVEDLNEPFSVSSIGCQNGDWKVEFSCVTDIVGLYTAEQIVTASVVSGDIDGTVNSKSLNSVVKVICVVRGRRSE